MTALAVPTRNYAAVLVAAGAVIAKVKASDTRRRVSSAAHFEMLSSLPAGTSVLLRKGRKEVKGILVGTKDMNINGTLMIGVQIQNRKGGSLTEWLPPKSSPKVQVSPRAWTQLPADAAKSAGANTSNSKFIRQIFEGMELWDLVTNSSLDCVMLGNVRSLEREARETKLSVGSHGWESSAGSLQDILRVRRLSTTNKAYRSDILSASPRGNAMKSEKMVPQLVIFDGAVGFLKWRDNWSHCNWVVILDRTESRFEEAVQIIDEEHSSRISDAKLKLSAAPPDSVEVVSFTVVR